MFTRNVGKIDRNLRIVIGVALLAWFFLGNSESPWHYALLIGVMPLITAAMGTCPLYTVLGLSSRVFGR